MIRFALVVASVLGFVLTAALGNMMVPLLRELQRAARGTQPDSDAPDSPVPTMGGLCLMVGTLAAVGVGWLAACAAQPSLLGSDRQMTSRLLIALLGSLAFGAVGLADDLARIRGRYPNGLGLGLRRTQRLALECIAAALVLGLLALNGCLPTGLILPGAGYAECALAPLLWAVLLVAMAEAARVADGADGLVVNGTTGESPTVFYPQKLELFRAVVRAVNGRIPVIANVGDNCTADTVYFAQDAAKQGVDGFMCVVPYYNKPPQEGLYRHFKTIADSTDMPIILYNIPGRCSINMEGDTTLRLAHNCDNVVAIKEASGNFEQIKYIIDNAPAGFDVYSGDDSSTLDIMELGGVGVISTIGNVAPDRMKAIVDLAAKGEWDAAREANEALMPLMKGLFETSNPILVKEALSLVGFPVGGVRLPLVDATPEQSARLASIMREVGVLD